jgi:hypothetical protein
LDGALVISRWWSECCNKNLQVSSRPIIYTDREKLIKAQERVRTWCTGGGRVEEGGGGELPHCVAVVLVLEQTEANLSFSFLVDLIS